MGVVRFVRSYIDQSVDSGFQFEFFCDRCGSGYQTKFVPTNVNTLSNVLDAAGSLFGGVFSAVSELSESGRDAGWKKAHDLAFNAAVQEVMPYFHQCRGCGSWIDDACWDNKRKSCQECGESEAEDCAEDEVYKTCPECDASVSAAAKFCPECGHGLKAKTCKACGSESEGKFCSDCGQRMT